MRCVEMNRTEYENVVLRSYSAVYRGGTTVDARSGVRTSEAQNIAKYN